jgi:hypothetical protein
LEIISDETAGEKKEEEEEERETIKLTLTVR